MDVGMQVDWLDPLVMFPSLVALGSVQRRCNYYCIIAIYLVLIVFYYQ